VAELEISFLESNELGLPTGIKDEFSAIINS
jgi:hypothetical protein